MSSVQSVKDALKRVPVLYPLLARIRRKHFRTSAQYWEERYRAGGHSGQGSYGRLAAFKAQFLNQFVRDHQIASVLEFGCGDGNQLRLAEYPSYTGIDISQEAVRRCRAAWAGDTSRTFFHSSEFDFTRQADLALSLDVVYHLVEDEVFASYMRQLFDAGRRYVIVYSSNCEDPSPAPHVRHRRFTDWVRQHAPNWQLLSTVKNSYASGRDSSGPTSFADFYVFARNSAADAPHPS